MKWLCCILVVGVTFGNAYAQVVNVSGTVRGEGKTLVGANIIEKGTTNGTLSDDLGRYSIAVAENGVLVVSRPGFRTVEVSINNSEVLDVTLEMDPALHGPHVNVGYAHTQRQAISAAVVYLEASDFNRGYIFQAAQLWQGRVAGLSIYNRGGNPNEIPLMRIRGTSSFEADVSPLIVIDGVAMADLGNVDPDDIASISVLKDGAAASIYGIRGSHGVILVTTKKGSRSPGLSVSFRTEGAASVVSRKQPALNAAEFVEVGGNDLGAVTDWQDEITRSGWSQHHHLAVSAEHEHSSFRVSTHLRSVEGILLKSGFDQVNTRVNVTHRELDDRLRLHFNMSVTSRNSNFSLPEAFRYATVFNPTAPIRFSNGVFYQPILFENYNPVAVLLQNKNEGRSRKVNYSGTVEFDITDGLTATFNAAQQASSNFRGSYYSRESFYYGLSRGGLAQRYSDDARFTLAEAFLSYQRTGENLNLQLTGGYSFQQDQTESFGAELGNFPSDELGYNALEDAADILTGLPNLIDIYSNATPINKIEAGFLRALLGINKKVQLTAAARYEGSSKLGPNKKAGLFLSTGANADLMKWFQPNALQQLNLRLAYGTTGAIPTQAGLASDLYDYTFINGGTLVKIRDANPDLKWEQKNETNLGIDWGRGRWTGSFDVYHRTVKDLILDQSVDWNQYPSGRRFENAATLRGRGLEVAIQYQSGSVASVQWRPSLVLSSNRTVVEAFPVQAQLNGFLDAPGSGGTLMIRTAVGEKFGQIWSPVFDGVDVSGAPLLKDTNGDGILQTLSYQALDPQTDFVASGYAFPSWELGWNNQFTYRNWQVTAFFRGAFGHSLVNLPRLAFEPLDAGAINTFNRIRSKKEVEGLLWSGYSSLYVERADFLMLDNLTLAYQLPLRAAHRIRSANVYATVQRAFTITGYSGVNPEPVWVDRSLDTPNYFPQLNALSPGIDRNSNYLPARTFTVGVVIGL
ncbi:MAG: SusC/RagA family TonB-linked outer membrane protein [Bacteroidota bacterium]